MSYYFYCSLTQFTLHSLLRLNRIFYVLLHLVIGAGHILFVMFFAYFFVVSLILVTFATT